MSEAFIVFLADTSQVAVVPICLIAYLPQWVAIVRSGSSRNVSLSSQLLWLISSALASFYAATHFFLTQTGAPLFLASTANTLCGLVTLALVYGYRDGEDDNSPPAAAPATVKVSEMGRKRGG